MSIYLYIKTHQTTGLKYFGKTTKDPYSYNGSGKYWQRHLKKYGNLVDTEVLGYFTKDEVEPIALKFSNDNNIVESKEWANLIEENGLDGGHTTFHSKEYIQRLKKEWKGEGNPTFGKKWFNDGKINIVCYDGEQPEGFLPGKYMSETNLIKMKEKCKANSKDKTMKYCPHCGKGMRANLSRHIKAKHP